MRVALTIDTEHPDHPCRAGNPAADRRRAARGRARAPRSSCRAGGRARTPTLARRIAEHGHVIGNHSNSHARMSELTDDGIRASITDAGEAIVEACRASIPRPWFRCPYGEGQDDPRIRGLLDGWATASCDWDVDPNDWEAGAGGRRAASAGARRACAAHGDGALVLLHAWPDVTADTLALIVDELRADGAELVGIDEL